MAPIAVVGNLSRDLVGAAPPRVGGGAYYAAQALRALGVPARIVTRCGAEDADELLPPLQALGVPVTARAGRATWTFSFDYDGDRRRMRVDRVGDSWTPDDVTAWVDDALGGACWVHLAPLGRPDFCADTVAALARGGRALSYDGQGLVRPGRTGELRLDGDYDAAVLRHLRVLKLAEEEAEVVAGSVDTGALAALGVPEVVVTFGARGALVAAEGAAARVPAVPVHADPTGAGDLFATGYLVARAAGTPPADAASAAARLVERLLAERLKEA